MSEETNIQIMCMVDNHLYVLKPPHGKGLAECMKDVFSVLFDLSDEDKKCKNAQCSDTTGCLNFETPSAVDYE